MIDNDGKCFEGKSKTDKTVDIISPDPHNKSLPQTTTDCDAYRRKVQFSPDAKETGGEPDKKRRLSENGTCILFYCRICHYENNLLYSRHTDLKTTTTVS